jgi:hypothetical protein
MAARVTQQDVEAILDTDISDLSPFITAANLTVTKMLSGEDLSDDQLKEIERWLAAHFASIRDPRISAEKTGDAQVTYHGRSDLGLNFTPYGQQVKLLDTTGNLARLGMRRPKFQTVRAPEIDPEPWA